MAGVAYREAARAGRLLDSLKTELADALLKSEPDYEAADAISERIVSLGLMTDDELARFIDPPGVERVG